MFVADMHPPSEIQVPLRPQNSQKINKSVAAKRCLLCASIPVVVWLEAPPFVCTPWIVEPTLPSSLCRAFALHSLCAAKKQADATTADGGALTRSHQPPAPLLAMLSRVRTLLRTRGTRPRRCPADGPKLLAHGFGLQSSRPCPCPLEAERATRCCGSQRSG